MRDGSMRRSWGSPSREEEPVGSLFHSTVPADLEQIWERAFHLILVLVLVFQVLFLCIGFKRATSWSDSRVR